MQKSFFNNELEQRFSLRKYAIGLCSVCLGSFILGSTGGQTVKADTVKMPTTTVSNKEIEGSKQSTSATLDITTAKQEQKQLDQNNKQFASVAEANDKQSTSATPDVTTAKQEQKQFNQENKQSVSDTETKLNNTSTNIVPDKSSTMVSTKIEPTKNDFFKPVVASSNHVNNSDESINNRKLSDENAAKLEALYGTSYVKAAEKADNLLTAKNWDEITSAYNSGATGVDVDGDITATQSLNIASGRAFTISSSKSGSLNLNGYEINNTGILNLKDITLNGSVMGNGIVNIEGDVTSNVNDSNGYNLSDTEKSQSFTNQNQTKGYNIQASNVNVGDNAALTINRSSIGDGIHLVDSNSLVNVGNYAKLSINMNTNNDLNTEDRYHDAGIFAESNGDLKTGYKSVVILNTSIGQGVSMTGTRPLAWDSNRFDGYGTSQSRSGGSGQINLGQYSTLNFTGRDGFILGNGSNFNVGEYANVHFENKGRGVALDLANNANINIGDHAVTYFHSVGKSTKDARGNNVGPSGSMDGYNYIGVNEGGNITIGKDATFRVILEGRGNNEWDDVVQLDTRGHHTPATFKSEKGAIVDIRDDDTDFYAELISFPLGTPNAVIDIEDPLLLNLQRYSAGGKIIGWMAGVGGTGISNTSAKYTANLIYMGGENGKVTIGGTDYVVYQQIKSDNSQQIWTDINTISYPQKGFSSLNKNDNGINSAISINGKGLTGGIPANHILDGQGALDPTKNTDVPYYGISTMRASHQIWIPHETETVIKGTHKNTIKYVYEDGTPVLGEDGKPLVVTQDVNLERDLTLDLTPDQIKSVQDYALQHNVDETLAYIRSGYSVTKDSKWKITDRNGNEVKNPYDTVKSPSKDGYVATIKSTNILGLKKGADATSVTAKLTVDPDVVVKDGKLADTYRIDGKTGIPDNYETVVVYKKEAPKVKQGSINVKYIDDTTNKTLTTDPLKGFVGDKINYATKDKIAGYEKQGYELVSNNFKDGNETYTEKGNNFEVHLKHGLTPVTPEDPKGVDLKELKKPVKETIHYTGAGDKTPKNVVQDATWTRNLTQDKVTGELVPNGKYNTEWTPSKENYDEVKSPEVEGFHPNKETVPVTKVTQDNFDVTVKYSPNGTEVPYKQIVRGTVKYIDDTTKGTLKTDKLQGFIGDKINYATAKIIKGYEDSGYKLVSNNFKDGNETYTRSGNNFEVHLVHTYSPITPNIPHGLDSKELIKDVKETVKYVGAGGKTPKNVVQTSQWTRQFTWDNVDKKIVPNGELDKDWSITPGQKTNYDEVKTPEIDGYHANKTTVPATKVSQDDITVIVEYSPNGSEVRGIKNAPASQTTKFVDENGKELADSVVQHSKFHYSGDIYDKVTDKKIKNGSWNEESHTFNSVNAPVIKGYVAEAKTADGLTATVDKPNVTNQIVYHKIGKIVPVDPDHNPIPDAPTPEYKNDPTDPTKVTPNEPTPNVPSWHRQDPNQTTITPTDPTKDTAVVYRQIANGTVKYIDDTANTTLDSDELPNGYVGDKISYTTAGKIDEYEKQGYKLVSNSFKDGNATYTKTGNNFEVHFVHIYEPVEDSQTITETIHYVDTNNQPVAPDHVASVVITITGTRDKVTGSNIWNTPSTGHFDYVLSPKVSGMTPDKKVVPRRNVHYGDSDITETVVYTPNKTPEKPEEPSKPNKPSEPTSSDQNVVSTPVETPDSPKPAKTTKKNTEKSIVTPQIGVSSNKAVHSVPSSSNISSSKAPMNGTVQATTINNSSNTELPQTGDSEDPNAVVLGTLALGAAGLMSLAYFDSDRKKKRN